MSRILPRNKARISATEVTKATAPRRPVKTILVPPNLPPRLVLLLPLSLHQIHYPKNTSKRHSPMLHHLFQRKIYPWSPGPMINSCWPRVWMALTGRSLRPFHWELTADHTRLTLSSRDLALILQTKQHTSDIQDAKRQSIICCHRKHASAHD